MVEEEDKTVSPVLDKGTAVSGPSSDDVRAALELMPADQRDALLEEDYDSLPRLRLIFLVCLCHIS